jgi:hypothetical protein
MFLARLNEAVMDRHFVKTMTNLNEKTREYKNNLLKISILRWSIFRLCPCPGPKTSD